MTAPSKVWYLISRIRSPLLCAMLFCSASARAQTPKVYWTNFQQDSVQRADLNGNNVESLITSGIDNPIAIDLDLDTGMMYIVDRGNQRIVRASLNGTGLTPVVTGENYPFGIALDVAQGKMYWTRRDSGQVSRSNLNGSSIERLTSGIGGLLYIDLDLVNGKIYIPSDSVGKVLRLNLDGSNLEDTASGTCPQGIALDVAGGKMYWTDSCANTVSRANLDGSSPALLVSSDASQEISLDLAAGKMYWGDHVSTSVRRADLDGNNVEVVFFGGSPIGIALELFPSEACCLSDGSCSDLSPSDCTTQGGTSLGESTSCATQPDGDGDGVKDACDNCPDDANAGQEDTDGDGPGDACDACPGFDDHVDMDGDGVADGCDECPGIDDSLDCNMNASPDCIDISGGTSTDCDGNVIPDECEANEWVGADGGAFDDSANWDPVGVPLIAAVLRNTTADDNQCNLTVPGETSLCLIRIDAAGAGAQALRLDSHSTLRVASGLDVGAGGALRCRAGSAVVVDAATSTTQTGEIEIRSLALVSFDSTFTNGPGGLVTLLDGTLAAGSVTNDAAAMVTGFGTIDGDMSNDGNMVAIADTQVIGDLANDGTIAVQSGLLTVTGDLSGTGTIIGGFGGRSGDSGGIEIQGDYDLSTIDWRRIDLTGTVLRMAGDPANGVQLFEVAAADRGHRGIALPDASLYSIGVLRIGPSATTVRLVDRRVNTTVDNRLGRGHEAVYVSHLILDSGVTLDLGGLNLYYGRITLESRSKQICGVRIVDSLGGGGLHRLD